MSKQPKLYDTADIITDALQADKTGQVWRDIIADDRQSNQGMFSKYDHEEWCYGCESYQCHCYEDRLKDEARDRERELELQEFERLEELERAHNEALEEDFQRQIDAKLEAEVEAKRAETEFNESFSYVWFRILGWSRYNRYAAPLLMRFHRMKKGVRH